MDTPIGSRPGIPRARWALTAAAVTGALLALTLMSASEARPRPGAHAREVKPAKAPRCERQAAPTATPAQRQATPGNDPGWQAQYNPKELGVDKVQNLGDTATHEVGHVREGTASGQSGAGRKKWEGPDLDASKNEVAIESME